MSLHINSCHEPRIHHTEVWGNTDLKQMGSVRGQKIEILLRRMSEANKSYLRGFAGLCSLTVQTTNRTAASGHPTGQKKANDIGNSLRQEPSRRRRQNKCALDCQRRTVQMTAGLHVVQRSRRWTDTEMEQQNISKAADSFSVALFKGNELIIWCRPVWFLDIFSLCLVEQAQHCNSELKRGIAKEEAVTSLLPTEEIFLTRLQSSSEGLESETWQMI